MNQNTYCDSPVDSLTVAPADLLLQTSVSSGTGNGSGCSGTIILQDNTTPKQPLVLDSLTANKVGMAENLVDTTALIIESIWPSPSGAQYSNKAPVIPLHIFVKETLRRSRTTLATLQLALYYIYKVRNQVLAAQEKIRQDQIQHIQQQQQRALQQPLPLSPNGSIEGLSEDEFKQPDYFTPSSSVHTHTPTNPVTPASLSPISLSASTPTSPILAKSEPVGCGRRMFLAALILASKFQQDRTYSNKAWSKISGLPVSEINLNEITFLKLIEYRLFVSQAVFQKWITILAEKGRIRDRASLNRSNTSSSVLSTTDATPIRRSSIQYCSNTLPSRMTCVTASSLEQQSHLPSFSVLLEKQRSVHSAPAAAPEYQFDFAPVVGVPTLPKLSMDNSISSSSERMSGLIQPESLPRQQQGMGAYLTHRWVQAQRQEYLKSRMQIMGYTFTESPRSSPLLSQAQPPVFASQQQQQQQQQQQEHQDQQGMILNNFQNNIIAFSHSRTYSVDRTTQRLETKLSSLVNEKHRNVQDFMPSPASSMSPKAVAGMKRRVSEAEESDAASTYAKDMQNRTRRRLSVSFLVDC
ncbi:hypothetical protein BGZ65_006884 [Modicella reniformis]|uniref:Uncharacterized protein n=1 Tax=Modicella reniformis TaxID=1440133 RepID=A0A9P6M8G9_9FUNG|nr:hypothetical protein BGZ65_006884 [Modicella reniformis]